MVTKVRILAPDYRNPIGDFGDHKLSSLGLHHNQTFASFDLREGEALKPEDLSSLKKAFTAAHKFAERPRGWIVLMGHYSCGKTHLAASIALYRRELGDDLIFKIVPDVLEDLKATFGLSSNISFSKQFEEFKSTNLLVLDDLGTQAPTPWVNEKLFQLFDHRYNAQLPTVITTSLALEELDPRLRSRMLDRRLCSIYGITVPPYTGSMKPVVETTTKRSRSKQR